MTEQVNTAFKTEHLVKHQNTNGENSKHNSFSSIFHSSNSSLTSLDLFINPFPANAPFYTHRKHQKTFGFLVFSGGVKWEHWPEMGYRSNAQLLKYYVFKYLLKL